MPTRHKARMKNVTQSALKESEQFPIEDDYTMKDMLRYDPPTPWWWLIHEWRTGMANPSRHVLWYWIGMSACMIVLGIAGLLLFTDYSPDSGFVSYADRDYRYLFIAAIAMSVACIVCMLYIMRRKRATG